MSKPANKKTIAVDIDEVLFPLAPTFLKYYNEQTGTSYNIDDLTSYYVEEITGESREVVLTKMEAYLKSEHYRGARPIKGAVDSISTLQEMYNLVVITARAPFFDGHTEEFLQRHFGSLYDSFYNIHRYDVEHKHLSKAEICKELSAIALVDDHRNYILDAAKHGITGLLFGDYAWNQLDKLPPNVRRVKNWQEVLEYFEREAGQ
jgi:uncharacterized HAD superfamily protein